MKIKNQTKPITNCQRNDEYKGKLLALFIIFIK